MRRSQRAAGSEALAWGSRNTSTILALLNLKAKVTTGEECLCLPYFLIKIGR